VARIGYARASTIDQDIAPQVAALKAAGCDIVREEQASGSSMTGRPELASVLAFLRKGDVLVVTRIDRLARSVAYLQTIVATIKAKGVALECTDGSVNTDTAAGHLAVLAVLAVAGGGGA
jgi:DNA invertase Pin-like site-specific DNA recombinase